MHVFDHEKYAIINGFYIGNIIKVFTETKQTKVLNKNKKRF